MKTRLAFGAALAALAFASAASAQTWPAKPIRWVVPYTPAGITDSVTRMVLQKVQEQQTGWNIVVENKPGANSIIGVGEVARAPGDGYTFVTVIGAHAANATLYAINSFTSLTGSALLAVMISGAMTASDTGAKLLTGSKGSLPA